MKRIIAISRFLRSTFFVCLVFVMCMLIADNFRAEGAVRSASALVPYGEETPEKIFQRGVEFQKEEKLDSALLCHYWLTQKYSDSNDKETLNLVGKSFLEMGQIYYVQLSDYMNAYRCLIQAESTLKDSYDKSSYVTALLNLGNLFGIYEYIFPNHPDGNPSRARDYYTKALRMAIDSGEWNLVLSTYINTVMLDLPFKVNPVLNQSIQSLLEDSIPDSLPDYRLSLLLCKGTDAISKRKFDMARQIMQQIQDSLGLEATRDKYMARICMAAVSIGQGKHEEAIRNINGIFTEKSNINDMDVHMEVYDMLSRCYEMEDDQEKANHYRIKYYEAKDTLTKQLVALEPTRLGIELSDLKTYAIKIDAERRMIRIILLFSLLTIVALVVISIVIYKKNRQLKLKNKVIFNQTKSLLDTPEPQNADEKKPSFTKPEKYRDSSMNSETREGLIIKIDEVLENKDEICDSEFSLQRLTQLVGSNTSYISRAVNEHYGVSFGNLLNKKRIQEACRRMANVETFGNLTIESISESVGFKTRSTFTKAFKLNMGMLPSEYAKLLKEQINKPGTAI